MSSKPTDSLTLVQPDDWHIHLRDGAALARTVNDAARQFQRVIVMPNLVPPVCNTTDAEAYRARILAALDSSLSLEPLMVLYLTDNTSAATIAQAKQSALVHAVKWYPAGATTNSASGVTDIAKIYPALQAMEEHDLVLSIHGEVTDSDVDIFDREAQFIERTLTQVVRDFPHLRIVFEHITTRNAVDFVLHAPANISATITAHHLLFNRNHMLAGNIRPHYYCLPILKRGQHQQALIEAATSGNSKFFLGTDSAPHSKNNKEAACGCAGAYTAHTALEFYATAFERAGALDKLEGFASFYGADFYQLPRNTSQVTLRKSRWAIPSALSMGDTELVPLLGGESLDWKLECGA
ncbi:MAG: dihydroorotase [Pseudomonadales bacterium]|nr:dihydroorotase [Gammaproteobacteria bacterium]NNL56827.1 dihydroorotase [Pseudomonadales bacterium]